MAQDSVVPESRPRQLSLFASIGKFVTRLLLCLALLAMLQSVVVEYSLPVWAAIAAGVVVAFPLVYWPTLGFCVVAAYVVILVAQVIV